MSLPTENSVFDNELAYQTARQTLAGLKPAHCDAPTLPSKAVHNSTVAVSIRTQPHITYRHGLHLEQLKGVRDHNTMVANLGAVKP